MKKIKQAVDEFRRQGNFKHNDGKVYRMDEVETEELPQCGHKSHIEKIMFLAVLARPRPELGFDGKICMVPVVEIYI